MQEQTQEVQEEVKGLTKEQEEFIDKATMAEIFTEVYKGKRPKDMPYEMYKQVRTLNNKALKDHKKGKVIWPARIISEDKKSYRLMKPYNKKEYDAFIQQKAKEQLDMMNKNNNISNNLNNKEE